MTSGRTLPWLQDNVQALVKFSWDAVYRDVRILDPQNRLQGVFNLTERDLGVEANYATLKQMFLAAAKATDSDADKLPDAWEEHHFGAPMNVHPDDDPDHDGSDNFTELAFGTHPREPHSRPTLSPRLASVGTQRVLAVTLRRPAGAALNYLFATSPDLTTWSTVPGEVSLFDSARNRFDGTGTVETLYTLPAGEQAARFLRVRALPR